MTETTVASTRHTPSVSSETALGGRLSKTSARLSGASSPSRNPESIALTVFAPESVSQKTIEQQEHEGNAEAAAEHNTVDGTVAGVRIVRRGDAGHSDFLGAQHRGGGQNIVKLVARLSLVRLGIQTAPDVRGISDGRLGAGRKCSAQHGTKRVFQLVQPLF